MKLKLLCDAADIVCPAESEDLEISSIATDSRDVERGGMFICICGLHVDAHRFIPNAIASGASCILVQEEAEIDEKLLSGAVILRAKNTRRASACIYDAWYSFPSRRLKMIGVTGTNGKTTVTHILRHILECALYKCGLIGTVGCDSAGKHLDARSRNTLANMTTPDPPELYRMLSQMVADGVEYVLMEVTSHALALGKLEPIRFLAGIFINLTPEHLDFHKTMDAYADAKAELFSKSELSIILADSPYAERMKASAGGRVVTCTAADAFAEYKAEDVSLLGQNGVSYRLSFPKGSSHIKCSMAGSFAVPNSLVAAACALELGIGIGKIKDALRSIAGVKGRMERVRLGVEADFTVMIDYAHTPDALENLLRSVKNIKKIGDRIVLLFGCGGDRDHGKRPLMGQLASELADAVIVTSDNSRTEEPQTIISQILVGMDKRTPCTVITDREDAIRYAIQNARAGDWILLAGKGHEEYEIDRSGRKPFSEKQIVLDAFEKRRTKERSQATDVPQDGEET